MNYLAHLHIADYCGSSLLGNLLGDFIKGDPSKQFEDESLIEGIKLHRFVDSYTDTHPYVRQAKRFFPPELTRFSLIVLDIYWDYCLVNKWPDYHRESLHEFCQRAQVKTLPSSHVNLPSRYRQVLSKMWEEQWIDSYRHLEQLEYVLSRVASRREKLSPLKDCYMWLETHDKNLQQVFDEFYPDILQAAKASLI